MFERVDIARKCEKTAVWQGFFMAGSGSIPEKSLIFKLMGLVALGCNQTFFCYKLISARRRFGSSRDPDHVTQLNNLAQLIPAPDS
jgi:hypothetical protein